ncbi:MAG: DUF3486 family protein [Methylococcales bacterium]|nr:DUF3486 family protein [Methylococcales bacterium]
MSRISSIELLPDDILAKLQALLLDPRVTQLEVTHQINALLVEQGKDIKVSKSAVNRYAISFEEMTAEIVETDRLAAVMLKELNIDNQSKVGQATAESLRVMLFRVLPVLKRIMSDSELDLKELKDVTGMVNSLATSHEKLERSATINEERSRLIRAQIRAEAAEELTQELKNDGISAEVEASIKRILIGK